MSYIADKYEFGPVALSAEQHRALGETFEDIMNALDHGEIEEIIVGVSAGLERGVRLMMNAAGDGGPRLKKDQA